MPEPESILEEAYRLTHGPRHADYGHPLEDFTRTAGLINVLFAHKLREPLDAEDAAQIQMLVKLSRHQNVRKRDNMVDAAGYAWVTWACTEERERRASALPDVEDYSADATFTPGMSVLAPVGTGPLTPMEFFQSQLPEPAVSTPMPPVQAPRGRLLACGCYGACSGHTTTAASPAPTAANARGPRDPAGQPYVAAPRPYHPID